MDQINRIEGLIKPILEAQNLKLYEICWRNEDKMKILQIAIMQADGTMNIDVCTQVSEAISQALDADDFIPFEYFLEVCSPGAERKLRTKEEIEDAIGEFIYIKFTNPTAGMDEVKGTLINVNDDVLHLEYMQKAVKKKIDITLDNIANIRLSVKI